MFAAVIPAQNEETRVKQVLTNISKLPLDFIIPVVNGSQDHTLEACLSMSSPKIYVIYFRESLGIDVPRAVGACFAKQLGSKGVLFVDGDMNGDIFHPLKMLIHSVKSGTDCALTNCYPYIYSRHPLTKKVLRYREILNRKIGLFHQLGLASPSHGPHAISGRLLNTLPIEALAVPPVEIALSKLKGLKVEVATALSHCQLGSQERSLKHTKMVAYTIIGDCLEALSILNKTVRHRSESGIVYDGYHPFRRFDLLEKFCHNNQLADIYYPRG